MEHGTLLPDQEQKEDGISPGGWDRRTQDDLPIMANNILIEERIDRNEVSDTEKY